MLLLDPPWILYKVETNTTKATCKRPVLCLIDLVWAQSTDFEDIEAGIQRDNHANFL